MKTIPKYNQAKTLMVTQRSDGGTDCWWWCVACGNIHHFNIGNKVGPTWNWDGNMDAPTFSPSLRYLNDSNCHTVVTGGIINYQPDCNHKFAGQKMPLPPLPEEWSDITEWEIGGDA